LFADILGKTPYLLGGFGINALIAVMALLPGALFGLLLGRLRHGRGAAARIAEQITTLLRPGWRVALIILGALLLLPALSQWGIEHSLPAWLVTATVLGLPVTGFASDRFAGFFRQMRAGELGAERSFFAAWLRYAPLIFIGTAIGGVFGSDEAFYRAAHLVDGQGSLAAILVLFIYVTSWFAAASALFYRSAQKVERPAVDPGGVKAVRLLRQRRRPAYEPRKTNGLRSVQSGEAQTGNSKI